MVLLWFVMMLLSEAIGDRVEHKDQVKDSDQWVTAVRKDQAKKNRKGCSLNMAKGFRNVKQILNVPFSKKTGFRIKSDGTVHNRKGE